MATKARADQSMQNVSIGPQLLLARSTNTPPPQVDHAEPALPDPQQGGHLEVGQPQGLGYGGQEHREPLVVQVGDPMTKGQAAEYESPVLPSFSRRLYRFRHRHCSA